MNPIISQSNAPAIRSVSQAGFFITEENGFSKAVREVVSWMREKNREIPDDALAGTPFRVGAGSAFPAEAVSIDNEGRKLWSAILEDTSQQSSSGHVWVTEFTIGEHDGLAAFGGRLSLVSRGTEARFSSSRPRCIFNILRALAAKYDGQILSNYAKIIDTDEDASRLIGLICNISRKLPVVVLSQDQFGKICADSDQLLRRISGLCHVFIATENASWALTNRLGKENSAFGGAARLYRPGFDMISDSPFSNPLWVFYKNDETKKQSVLNQITEQVLGLSRTAFAGDNNFPRYEQVRSFAAKVRVEKAKTNDVTDSDLIALYEDELARLSEELDRKARESAADLQYASDELKLAETARDEARSERAAARSRIALLEAALSDRGQSIQDEPLLDFNLIEDWSQRHLTGSIWISKKAIRETEKNGQFRDVELFARTLLMIRDFYVPMKKNPGNDRWESYVSKCSELGIIDDPCFAQRGAIKGFKEYKVTYDGAEHWCENHFKYGGGTDPKSMFRIYYHWHEEDQILLIGHMPTHLSNMMTN